jgi:hypothetical protein
VAPSFPSIFAKPGRVADRGTLGLEKKLHPVIDNRSKRKAAAGERPSGGGAEAAIMQLPRTLIGKFDSERAD